MSRTALRSMLSFLRCSNNQRISALPGMVGAKDTLAALGRYRSVAGIGFSFPFFNMKVEANYCFPLRTYPSDKTRHGWQFSIRS